MEEKRSPFTKRLGIAATVVSLTGGSIALWNQLKPEEELPDLSGRWTITNTVTASNGGKFDGEVYVYSVGVTQDERQRLSGTGEQVLYNGKPASSRFPIAITDGKHAGGKVSVNFTVKGNREFTGTLWLVPEDDDPHRLTGTFEYTAAGTTGTTEVLIK
jgi:hypothetical protein